VKLRDFQTQKLRISWYWSKRGRGRAEGFTVKQTVEKWVV